MACFLEGGKGASCPVSRLRISVFLKMLAAVGLRLRPGQPLFGWRHVSRRGIGTIAEEVLFHLSRQVFAGAGIG
jgi:hypothetical protein